VRIAPRCVLANASDPCLWAADYCTWAIQRKWERRDERAYELIAAAVASETLVELGPAT
jgi:hypothetical protein